MLLNVANSRKYLSNGKQQVIFEAFEASPTSEHVLAGNNALIWDFPGCSAQIPLSTFTDTSFQESLASFLEQAGMESLYRLQAHAQKAHVSVTEARDSTHPSLITQMLIPLLMGIGDHFQSPIIRKRVRDDVNIVEGVLPWRRLPFWLILRVATQRQLCLSLGNEKGRFSYKVLMNFLFAELLKDCTATLIPELTITLRTKLCRRMTKLEMDRQLQAESVNSVDCDSLFNRGSPIIKGVIEEASAQVENAWRLFKQQTTRIIPRLPSHAPDQALQLSLSNSGKYFDNLLSDMPLRQRPSASLDLPRPLDQAISQTQQFTDHVFCLATLEMRVSQDDQPRPCNKSGYETRCIELADQINNVFDQVGSTYDSDPEQMSIMILTLFTIWIRLDEYAIMACPLLGEYRPVFDPEILDVLQLSTVSSMRRLQTIQEYLAVRHSMSQYDNIMTQIGKDSLGVRYVSQSPEMQFLGRRIDRASDQARSAKEREWTKLCGKYDEHTDGISKYTCCCTWSNGKPDHRGCQKCWHRRTRKNMKIQVHEEFLPGRDPARAAVIFELAVPQVISAYRDATWKIVYGLAHPNRPVTNQAAEINLLDCRPLQPFVRAKTQRISFASKIKCFTQTHYKFKAGKIPLRNLLLPLAARFQLYDSVSKSWVRDFTMPLTFQHLCGVHIPGELRASVLPEAQHPPPTVDGPSSYEVQANQTECPANMSVHEFSAYQKLLAGNLRRWPNILVEMGSSNLNFSKEDTARLISQLALQAGPQSPGNDLRAIHLVFQEPAFLERLLELIAKRLTSLETNWREHNYMDLLITIILRLINLGLGSLRSRAETLLEDARNTTLNWVTQLRKKMQTALDADTVERAASYGFYAALLCRRTFIVFSEPTRQALTPGDLISWVQASIALQESLLVDISKLTPALRSMLLRDTKMAYHLQYALQVSLRAHPESVTEGVIRSWYDPVDGLMTTFSQWTFLPEPNCRWIVATTSEPNGQLTFGQTIHYNIIEGHLLVNGKPQGKLPLQIRNDEIIKDMFGSQHLLTYPSNLPGMSHRLVNYVENQEIHFGMRGDQVVIRACTKGGLLELVPSSIFTGQSDFDLPSELVDGCVHWLNINSACLEIRRKPVIWKKRSRDWVINIPGRRAYRGDVSLVDSHSDVFRWIATAFQGFERPEKLTVYQPRKGRLSVELRHLELSFYVNNSYLLECRQLKAVVDPNQDAGTWYGLESKIVLTGIDSQRRSIIVPLGAMKYKTNGMHVRVYVEDAREYGTYLIDETLNRLSCPPEPRLLYAKALCHALTSFCLPDTLTGRTGTEEAFHTLKSCASQPWTALGEAHQIEGLRNLCPAREYYPPMIRRFQRVRWDSNLTMTIQHDSYDLLVRAIMKKSENYARFSNVGLKVIDVEAPSHLRCRGEVCRRRYERPIVDTADQVTEDLIYSPRDRIKDIGSSGVYEIARAVLTDCPSIYMNMTMVHILESWPVIEGFHCNSSSSLRNIPLVNQIEDPINEQWGDLVKFCCNPDSRYTLLYRLGLLAFAPSPNMDIIRSLAAFSCIEELKSLRPPTYPNFVEFAKRGRPSAKLLQELVIQAYPIYVPRYDRAVCPWGRAGRNAHEHQVQCEKDGGRFVSHILQQWPTPADELSTEDLVLEVIDIPLALEKVKPEWDRRRANDDLESYIRKVQSVIYSRKGRRNVFTVPNCEQEPPALLAGPHHARIIPSIALDLVVKQGPRIENTDKLDLFNHGIAVGNHEFNRNPEKEHSREVVDLERILHKFAMSHDELRKQYSRDLLQSLDALKNTVSALPRDPKVPMPGSETIEQAIEEHSNIVMIYFERISNALALSDPRAVWLQLGEIWPCQTPVAMLELLRSISSHQFGIGMKEALIGYGLAITELQQLNRMRRALLRRDVRGLNEELRNKGHENWSPLEQPDWLLLEIESDILIRAEQADVARAIIDPLSKNNSVLQMNMGKGK